MKKETKVDLEKLLRRSQAGERNWKRKYEAEQKKRWTEEDFVGECKDILATARPLRAIKKAESKGIWKPHGAVLMFSDCQIGEKVQKKETGYQDYNPKIFEKELERLYEGLVDITEIHRHAYKVDKLHIFGLGDYVEGTGNIYRGQGSRIVTDVVEQALDWGVPAISNFFRSVARHYDEVIVNSVVGNHGRLRKKGEDLHYANWDYVTMRMVKEVLKDVPNIKMNVDKAWWKIVNVQGWKFYMEHGDAIQKYMRLPWYGIARADGDTTMMLQAMNKTYDYYCIGHFHEPFTWDRPKGQRICNGTFATGNAFAMHQLKTTVRPTQMFFLVHPEAGAIGHYPIRLDLKKQPK